MIVVGDVVVSGESRGVVWSVEGDCLVVLPVLHQCGRRHRSDVPITVFADMIQTGVGGVDLVVRPGAAVSVRASGQHKIGRLSGRLLADLRTAVDRECAASAMEARWRHHAACAAPDPF